MSTFHFQIFFKPSWAEISVTSSVLPRPDFRRLLWFQSVRSEIWAHRRSVRTACPCARTYPETH
ncbi:hypothetical protein PanWU01x14_171730 [Parasponia andersonii]|uniref:Uncharacterized protein n=1 Tax=Parasponia andersonii TaxID=3476 RepID=A0A2P5C9F7_PARAD|nr:hypothetical protein PanWU01x14_171730 [Parasponia andersonii]